MLFSLNNAKLHQLETCGVYVKTTIVFDYTSIKLKKMKQNF